MRRLLSQPPSMVSIYHITHYTVNNGLISIKTLRHEEIFIRIQIQTIQLLIFTEKILTLAGIWTRDLPGTKPICYQLSYPGLDYLYKFITSTHQPCTWSRESEPFPKTKPVWTRHHHRVERLQHWCGARTSRTRDTHAPNVDTTTRTTSASVQSWQWIPSTPMLAAAEEFQSGHPVLLARTGTDRSVLACDHPENSPERRTVSGCLDYPVARLLHPNCRPWRGR